MHANPGKRLTFYGVACLFLLLSTAVRAAAPTQLPGPDYDDPLAVAYDCLASLAPDTGEPATQLAHARADGDRLAVLRKQDDHGHSGWGYVERLTEKASKCHAAGSLDAFSDGSCNPPETPYMIQTGYAVACLAQLSIATKDPQFLNLAGKAIADSWNSGTTVPGCKNCFYYWYSYHQNDKNRYVRNTNLIMGLGVAWMYAATGDAKYRERALAIAQAEDREIRAGNYGYFGIDDPRYLANPRFEAERIENHLPHQVKALKDIGILLVNRQAIANSQVILDAFLNCNNQRCRPDNCKAWAAPVSCAATATIAPCILADRGEPYQSRCAKVVANVKRLNAFQIFLGYSTSEVGKLQPAQSSAR